MAVPAAKRALSMLTSGGGGGDGRGGGNGGGGRGDAEGGGDEGGSPLQKKLEKMAFDITKLGFAAAAFGAIIAAILWLILKFGEGSVLAIVDKSSHRRMLGSTGGGPPATCADFNMHGIVKQAASFFADKNCKDMTMMEQNVRYNFMCNMKEFNDNKKKREADAGSETIANNQKSN